MQTATTALAFVRPFVAGVDIRWQQQLTVFCAFKYNACVASFDWRRLQGAMKSMLSNSGTGVVDFMAMIICV